MKYLKNVFFLTLLFTSILAHSEWKYPPFTLTSEDDATLTPQISCDSSGNAFAVWTIIIDGTSLPIIQSSYFNANTLTWSDATDLTDGTRIADGAAICCDDFGNAFATWIEFDGTNYSIMTSQFDGNTWSSAVTLSTGEAYLLTPNPKICCNNSGEAFASWSRLDGSQLIVEVSQFNGSSWLTPVNLSLPGAVSYLVEICCDSFGNAITIWLREDINDIIQSSRFNGTTWSSAVTLSNASQPSQLPDLCCDDFGNAFAIWPELNGTNFIIKSSQFNGTTWLPSESLSIEGESSTRPQICCNNSGNAFAAWETSGLPNYTIYSSHFNGTSWTNPSDVSQLSSSSESARFPAICCDELGNAVAAWHSDQGTTTTVQASSYSASSMSWSSPPDILSSPSEDHPLDDEVRICCGAAGRAVAIWWTITSPTSIIESTYFLSVIVSPPENFAGGRVSNRFPSQSVVSAHLNWTPNSDPEVTSFKIFRDGTLIATISSQYASYTDCNIDPCQTYTYSIVSVNAAGDESSSESISF